MNKILSIDGGGIKGIFAASFLQRLRKNVMEMFVTILIL